jgi:hypothetical protein
MSSLNGSKSQVTIQPSFNYNPKSHYDRWSFGQSSCEATLGTQKHILSDSCNIIDVRRPSDESTGLSFIAIIDRWMSYTKYNYNFTCLHSTWSLFKSPISYTRMYILLTILYLTLVCMHVSMYVPWIQKLFEASSKRGHFVFCTNCEFLLG